MLSWILLAVPVAHAQLSLPGKVTALSSPSALQTFICEIVLTWLFTAAILFSIAMALVAAYRYLSGAGNPDRIKLASNTLMYAAVGVAVAILARTLPVLVGSFVAGEIQLDPCASASTTGT